MAAAAALAVPGIAQIAERRANFTGGAGNDTGKCTIEVYVDGSAEVEIRGDRGILRTLSGQPAQWRRFVCSGPLPANPGDFRFVGIDGRGRQDLLQNPRSGRGAAVVRIQDSEGGAEGYTFDLIWREGGGAPGPTGQATAARGYGMSPNDSLRACQDAVRQSADRQYGLRDINFRSVNAGDHPGSNDSIQGSFDVRRDNYSQPYRFSCAINLENGMVRRVDISRGQDENTTDRHPVHNNAISECQRAARTADSARRIPQRGIRFDGAGHAPECVDRRDRQSATGQQWTRL